MAETARREGYEKEPAAPPTNASLADALTYQSVGEQGVLQFSFGQRMKEFSAYSAGFEQSCYISSPFLDILFKEWEERKTRGLFHHDISCCDMKVLPGNYYFVATLIEGRDNKKRPTEFGMERVLQPFDTKKFNFTKVKLEELLLVIHETESEALQISENTTTATPCSSSAILINVSPIGYGHVLSIPRLMDCLPQMIDHQTFFLAILMAKESSNPFFRVGYNSLVGFATINHLHFQAYYLTEALPVERAQTKAVLTLDSGISIEQLSGYPVRGLVFEGGKSLEELSDVVAGCCLLLQENNKPYNVLISNCAKRVFLLLQCYAERVARGQVSPDVIEMRMNPAVWELSGHLVMKRRKDFEEATEATICEFLLQASVSEDQFEEIKGQILTHLFTA